MYGVVWDSLVVERNRVAEETVFPVKCVLFRGRCEVGSGCGSVGRDTHRVSGEMGVVRCVGGEVRGGVSVEVREEGGVEVREKVDGKELGSD